MESITTPQVVDSTATHKICPGCSNFNKFKMTKGKMSGRVCIACTSKKNNARLKEKGYYKQYYQQHSEQLKQADKVRYQRVKAEKNLVKFTFPDYVVVGEAKNDDIEV